jgi:hypothetical protein
MITAGQTYVEGDCRRCGDQLQIRETWSRAEVTTFLAIAASDRLCVVWRLSLHGLRRGEAPSLRWPDINLRARVDASSSFGVPSDAVRLARWPGLSPAR